MRKYEESYELRVAHEQENLDREDRERGRSLSPENVLGEGIPGVPLLSDEEMNVFLLSMMESPQLGSGTGGSF